MQPGPANELYIIAVQVKIPGQCGLNVAGVGIAFHRLAQFDYSTELIAATIGGIGQYELRVVLCRHGYRLRVAPLFDCELQHKTRQLLRCSKIPRRTDFFASDSIQSLKLGNFGRGAQICCRGICNIRR